MSADNSLPRRIMMLLIVMITIGFASLLIGCSLAKTSSEKSLEETQSALSVQMTIIAQQQAASLQSTIESQQATLEVQVAQATEAAQIPASPTPLPLEGDPGAAATQAVKAAQATIAAQQATEIASLPTAVPTISPADLEERMKSASILLYEDMVYDTSVLRYVQKTIQKMGLNAVDVGNAKGLLKSQMISGGPTGKGWDLVIISAEAKQGISGEFFNYVNQALDQGSSVILEVWYLDQVIEGAASSLLARCGVEFQADWSNLPAIRQVMFPVNNHPILREPNSNLSFTNVTSKWASNYDIGDLLKKSPNGDATIVLAIVGAQNTGYGTLAVCVDDRLILQTFSSHQLAFETMQPVWENYIYHALKTRFMQNP